MSEQPENPVAPDESSTGDGPATVAAPAWTPPETASAWRPPSTPPEHGPGALVTDRPEIAVGAAFAGGLVLALVLKRLAR